jgi:hypothetical protein
MRRLQRLIAASVLIVLSGAVAGCSSGISSWDPMDMLDWIDTKKKLPGDRKPVFPEGVPGLEQGVPKSLYKGASQQEIDRQNAQAAAAAAAPPPEDAKSKRAAKSKSKQQDAASTDTAATPGEDGTAAAPQAPKPKKIVRQRTTAPPPDQPADAQPAQPAQPAQQSAAPFPAPLPGGTFSR